MAQQRLLEADDLQADLAANSALAEHVRSCPECQQLVAKLEHLTVAAQALSGGPEGVGGTGGPSPDFLARVARLEAPAAPLAKLGPVPHRGMWARRAAAAAIILAVGLLALSVCLFNGKTARGDTLLADLAAWNLQISQTADATARKAVYQQRVAELKQRLDAAALSAAERQLAQGLLDNADKQVQENDPLAAAQRMTSLASQVQALRTDTSSTDSHSTLDAVYRDLARSVQENLQAVDPGKLTPPQQQQWQQLQKSRPIVPAATGGAMRPTFGGPVLAGGGYGGMHGPPASTGGPVMGPQIVVLQEPGNLVGAAKSGVPGGNGPVAPAPSASRSSAPAVVANPTDNDATTGSATSSSAGPLTRGSAQGRPGPSAASASGAVMDDGDGWDEWLSTGGKQMSANAKIVWHVTHSTRKPLPGETPTPGGAPPGTTVAITDPAAICTDTLWRAQAARDAGSVTTAASYEVATAVQDADESSDVTAASALVLQPLKQMVRLQPEVSDAASSTAGGTPMTLPEPWDLGQQDGLAIASTPVAGGTGLGAPSVPSSQGAPEPATWLVVLAGAALGLTRRKMRARGERGLATGARRVG